WLTKLTWGSPAVEVASMLSLECLGFFQTRGHCILTARSLRPRRDRVETSLCLTTRIEEKSKRDAVHGWRVSGDAAVVLSGGDSAEQQTRHHGRGPDRGLFRVRVKE